jgi:hypothetical protein
LEIGSGCLSETRYGKSPGANVCQPPFRSSSCLPPSHGTAHEAFLPACASCIPATAPDHE